MTDRQPAPGRLRVLQQFVNSLDMETGEDEIASREALADWLVRHDLLDRPAGLDDPDVARTVLVREALRDVLEGNAGSSVSPETSRVLDSVADAADLRLRFDAAGHARLEPAAPGLPGALGRMLVVATNAMADGTWERLKVCREDSCRWAFYDASRNRSGVWCSMAVCGNREKVRSYRTRRRGAAQGPPRTSTGPGSAAVGGT